MPDLSNLTFTQKPLSALEPGDLIVYKDEHLMRVVANLPSSNPGIAFMIQLAYWTHSDPKTYTWLEVKTNTSGKVPTFRPTE